MVRQILSARSSCSTLLSAGNPDRTVHSEECYCATIVFLLEAKRLDVGDKALFLIESIVLNGTSGSVFPVDPTTGSINWSVVSDRIKRGSGFRKRHPYSYPGEILYEKF